MPNINNTKRRLLFTVLGMAFAIAVTIAFFDAISFHSVKQEGLSLREGWNVQINDKIYKDVSLDDLFFSPTDKGDTVVMTTSIPEWDVETLVLRFLSCHSTVEMELNGQSIYKFGQKRATEGKLLGYGYHFVTLNNAKAGDEIRITLHVEENKAFTSIDAPLLCDGKDAVFSFISESKRQLFVGIFLIVFGICMMFITVIMSIFNNKFLNLFYVSVFSFLMGIWTLCTYHLMQIFTPALPLCTEMEFLSYYLAAVPLLLYFYASVQEKGSRGERIIYWMLLIEQSVFCVLVVVFQLTNIAHLPEGQGINQINCVLILIFIFYHCFHEWKEKNLSDRLLFIGMLILTAFIGVDIIRFNLQKYTKQFLAEDFRGISCIGVMIFILFLLVSFCMEIVQKIYSEAKQKVLEKNAYTDVMTNVANRRRCEEELAKIKERGNTGAAYGIISFDLNNLKRTNDSLGHDAGDGLITDFADALSICFSCEGLIGRMGGDEFIVILPDISTFSYERSMKQLDRIIQIKNAQKKPYKISTSYGFATSREMEDPKIEKVYKLADKRMYECKKILKREEMENQS